MNFKILRATNDDVDSVAGLFDAYRIFYKSDSDIQAAREFIQSRITEGSSTIFLALSEDDIPLGFTQLYSSFTSVGMRKILILNDLYVAPVGRQNGVASALIAAAKAHAIGTGYLRLVLETEVDNTSAQALYEKLGWNKEEGIYHYYLAL